MTSARHVRLFLFSAPLWALLLAIGLSARFTSSLAAQNTGQYAQYDRYDPYASSPVVDDRWQDRDLPAFVSATDGLVALERDGEVSRDIENVPLEVGDFLRTTRGRAEILFSDGSVLALDEHTTLTFASEQDVDLFAGRLRVTWRASGQPAALNVHAPAGTAVIRAPGDYRITLAANRRGEPEVELAVSRGSAELANALGRTLVREGTRALTTSSFAPSVPYAYTTPRDDFERWTDGLEAERYGVESARYLPEELRYYGGAFDRDGAWHPHSSYGWVWYPRVSVGWQPYDGGRWSFVVRFGYTWVGGTRWDWPTHHYGRWDRAGTRWFWVPSRPVHTRPVGYAVPRRSYTAAATYYTRPARAAAPTRRADTTWQSSRATTRPATTRPVTTRPANQAPPRESQATPRAVPRQAPTAPGQTRTPNPRAVPRTARPVQQSRSAPSTRTPQASPATREAPVRRETPATRAAPSTRQAPAARPAPATRPAPTSTRSAPPVRSAPSRPSATSDRSSRPSPPAASPAPQSGSRTPSASASGGSRAGTAVRRGGGGR